MKAVFVIPVYKRLELTRLCVNHLVEQGSILGFDVICIGDLEAKAYCKGAKFYEFDNNPLSDKLNFGLSKCKKYDRVVIWGSDNFATDEVLKPIINTDADVIGYDSIYFYSNRTKKASLFKSNKMTIGVGRSYSRKVLEFFDYKLYRKKANSGIDRMAYNLYNLHFKEKVLNLQQGYLLDVKHEINITNPLIVKIGNPVEPFWHDLIKELDNIEPKDKEFIKRKSVINLTNMKTIEIIKEVAGMKVGIKKTVPIKTAKNLINRGLAKEVATTKESKKIVTKTKEDEGSTKKPRAKRSKSSNGKASKK